MKAYLYLPMMALAVAVHGGPVAHAALIKDTTFTSADAATKGSDGRGTGFFNPGGATFDTYDGWTWYTLHSTTNDNLTIPFGVGTATIGEQGIRVGGGLELQADRFNFGYGGANVAIALRSQSFAVGAGLANVDWTLIGTVLGGFKTFASQTGGSSWFAITDATNFAVVDGTLEVVFVANDGADTVTSSGGLSRVIINAPLVVDIPAPAALPAGLALLGVTALRRRRR